MGRRQTAVARGSPEVTLQAPATEALALQTPTALGMNCAALPSSLGSSARPSMRHRPPAANGPMARDQGDLWRSPQVSGWLPRGFDVSPRVSGLCSEVACPLQDGTELSRFLSKTGGHATLSTPSQEDDASTALRHSRFAQSEQDKHHQKERHHARAATEVVGGWRLLAAHGLAGTGSHSARTHPSR